MNSACAADMAVSMYVCNVQCACMCMFVCTVHVCAMFAVWDAAAGKCGEGETGARYKVHTSLSPPPLPLLNTNSFSICFFVFWDSFDPHILCFY